LIVAAESAVRVAFHAYRVDAGIGPPAARHDFQRLPHVHLLVVQRLGIGPLTGLAQPCRKAVNRDHPLRAEEPRTLDCKEAHRAASPYRDGIALVDAALLGCHVAGWKDIRQEEYLLIAQVLRDCDG